MAERIAKRIKDRIKGKLGKVFRGTYLIPPFRRSAKGEENMQRRKLENLNLLDDFLFGTMVTYPGIGEAFVRELLKIIFQKEFGPLTVVPQKIYYGTDTDKHGARLDVYLEESSGEEPGSATVYDMEPDNNSDKQSIAALPKRTRFYHAKIDASSLKSGES